MKNINYKKFVDVWIETGNLIQATASAGSVAKNRDVLSAQSAVIKRKKEVDDYLCCRLGEEFKTQAQVFLYIAQKIPMMNDSQKTKTVRLLKKIHKEMDFFEKQLEKAEGAEYETRFD